MKKLSSVVNSVYQLLIASNWTLFIYCLYSLNKPIFNRGLNIWQCRTIYLLRLYNGDALC